MCHEQEKYTIKKSIIRLQSIYSHICFVNPQNTRHWISPTPPYGFIRRLKPVSRKSSVETCYVPRRRKVGLFWEERIQSARRAEMQNASTLTTLSPRIAPRFRKVGR